MFFSCDLAHSVRKQILNPLRLACSMGTFPTVIKEGCQQGFLVGKCLAPILELTQQEKLPSIGCSVLEKAYGDNACCWGNFEAEKIDHL